METVRSWIKEALVGYALKALSQDNLKAILSRIVERLKLKAAQTETFADDWIVEFLESVVNSDAKIALLYDHLVSLINGRQNGLVVSSAENADVYEAMPLAEGLLYHAQSAREYSSLNIGLVVQLLNIVVPILLEWFSRNGK